MSIVSFFTPAKANKINMVCLIAAICWVLFLPTKKQIWYDETVSVLISKGISHNSPAGFANTTGVSNISLDSMNTIANVYHATIADNGNSFLYNICLHWFTNTFGNTVPIYVIFSKLCAIAALIAFFIFCNLLFEGTLFATLAILLFTSDTIFWGMGHEIRAYEMGMFFVTIAAVYCYKFLYKAENPGYLFMAGLFSVGAILSHYLAVYIIIVFIGYLIATKKARLFSVKNILALCIPVFIVAIYFCFAIRGFQTMSSQNADIQLKKLSAGFSIGKAIVSSMNFSAQNFKIVFPAFKSASLVIVTSFLIIMGVYIAALRSGISKQEKKNLNFLFIMGISSSIFLLLLSIKAHHYTPLYTRYYSFGVPFSILFTVYSLKVLFGNPKLNKVIVTGITLVVVIPCISLYAIAILHQHPQLKYNHPGIAKSILASQVTSIECPGWNEAFLLSGFLPPHYNIQYSINNTSPDFILHSPAGVERIPLIRDDN